MSVIYSFMDDCAYGADEVNQVFSKLTTAGVSLFNYTNGDNPLVSLNDAVKGFIAPGVELYNIDACKVMYDEESEKFTVGTGNAFMLDGSSITIDSESYDITEDVILQRKVTDGDVWVFFYRNIPENKIDILVEATDEKYNSEYAVPLAKISAENLISDNRTYAKTRVAPCSANVVHEISVVLGTFHYRETGYELRRTILENVFPGATKVYLNGVLCEIQHVDIEAGETLSYSRAYHNKVSNDIKVAFNMTAEGLELWAYQPYDSATAGTWALTIF